MLFGMINLLLSNHLMMVYFTLISSTVPLVFMDQRNSTKSPILIFLLVINIIHAIIFSIVVSMANQMLSEMPHMISAVSKPMI